jgi:hypothetical protein
MARKTSRLDFSVRNYIFGWADFYQIIQFFSANFCITQILQNRDFLFSIQSHVDVYLKFKSCAIMYKEGIQSITLTKASF